MDSVLVAVALPQYAEGGREPPREERFWEVLRCRGLAASDKSGWRLVPLWSVHVGLQGGSPLRSVSQKFVSAPCVGQFLTGVATRSWAHGVKFLVRETGLEAVIAAPICAAGAVAAWKVAGCVDRGLLALLLGAAALKSGTALAGLDP